MLNSAPKYSHFVEDKQKRQRSSHRYVCWIARRTLFQDAIDGGIDLRHFDKRNAANARGS